MEYEVFCIKNLGWIGQATVSSSPFHPIRFFSIVLSKQLVLKGRFKNKSFEVNYWHCEHGHGGGSHGHGLGSSHGHGGGGGGSHGLGLGQGQGGGGNTQPQLFWGTIKPQLDEPWFNEEVETQMVGG